LVVSVLDYLWKKVELLGGQVAGLNLALHARCGLRPITDIEAPTGSGH
jgi:hypothetical protein